MVAGCASLKVFCTYLSTSDVFPTRPASPQVKVKVNPRVWWMARDAVHNDVVAVQMMTG